MKDLAIRIAVPATRLYIRYFPLKLGKSWLWHRVVRKYLAWRPLELRARSRDGLLFLGSFPDFIHTFIYFFGVWEPNVTAYLRAVLKPGDVFIDIGANVGTHTLLASRLVGSTGRVHAIEASPSIFRRLQMNLTVNAVTNVRTYQVAVSDRAGPISVFLHDADNLGATTVVASEAALLDATLEQIVEGQRLQDIVPDTEICAARLIKIDVEGAEWPVVSGMRDLLPALRQDAEILVEVNARALMSFGATFQDFLAIFAEAGFSPFEIMNSYSPELYLGSPSPPTPLRHEIAFGDLLFRRTGGSAT